MAGTRVGAFRSRSGDARRGGRLGPRRAKMEVMGDTLAAPLWLNLGTAPQFFLYLPLWVQGSDAKHPDADQDQRWDRLGQRLLRSSNCRLVETQARCGQIFLFNNKTELSAWIFGRVVPAPDR